MLSKRVVPAIVLLLASTLVTAAIAQEDPFEPIDPEDPAAEDPFEPIDPDDLESLAIVQAEMMIAQQEAQQQIDGIIAESGVAYEEFLRMYYSMIGPDGEFEGDPDADVDEEFRELSRVAAANTETANQLDNMVSELIRQHQMH